MRRLRPAIALAAVLPVASAFGVATATTAAGQPSTHAGAPPHAGPPPHVMVVVMENHEYGDIIGSPSAPYINGLANRYGLATASYARTHPSLPNYLELASGSTQGITDDCTSCTADGTQLVDQLQTAGIGWRAYMESMPTPCYTGSGSYPYDKNHDPFVYAPHIVGNPAMCDNVVPYSQLSGDLSSGSAPPFLWVTPNVLDDMHDGSVQQGDTWLSQQLPAVMGSSWYAQGGTIILTFDEGTSDAGCCAGAAGGRIATIVISQSVAPGARQSAPVDHAGVLRTVEDLYGLPPLADAADSSNGTLLGLLGGAGASGGAANGGGDGGVFAFGDAPDEGSLPGSHVVPARPIVGMARAPDGKGYWLTGADGGIFAFGDAGYFGSMGGSPLRAPVVGMAATPDGGGYWLVASDGGIFAFGDAAFFGSMGATTLSRPVVAMAATPDGKGYWLTGADGGIFAFGDAAFAGSLPAAGVTPAQPVVAIAATPDSRGYWLTGADGGIFAFGDAGYFGSVPGALGPGGHVAQPVVAMAATPDGRGYWLAARDGGVFAFGDAPFEGSMGGQPLAAPVAGMAASPDGQGYWLVG